MTLLAPWALWFAGVGAAVVALYILKIRRRRQEVPALDFWRQLMMQAQARTLFQRLKRWLSMLLWLLIVTCLILAIGNPVLSFGSIKPRAIAVIIDNSASMQTTEDDTEGTTRLDLALEALAELTARRPVSDEWMVIEAADAPRVVQPWTRDRSTVEESIERIAPFKGTGDLDAAAALAHQLLEGKQRPTIVIISDGAGGAVSEIVKRREADRSAAASGGPLNGAEPAFEEDSEDSDGHPLVVYWPLGAVADNLGITRLRVRLHRQKAEHHVYVQVVNAGERDVESDLVFEIDGVPTAVEPITMTAGETWSDTFSLNAPQGGVLKVSVERADALAVDNEAYAILEPIEPAVVWLVTPPAEAFFFERAMLAMEPLVSLEASRSMTIDDFNQVRDAAGEADLIIFNNALPEALPPRGRFVFVNALPEQAGARVVGELELPEMTIGRRDHPLVQYLNLGAVTLARAKRIDLLDRATVLARSVAGDPLMFLLEQPDRQMLVLAFDVLDSDLPFRNAFPLLLRNAVAHLFIEQSRWVEPQYAIGEPIELLRPAPDDVNEISVAMLEDDLIDEMRFDADGFVFTQATEQTALRLRIGEHVAYTAVNLASIEESRNAPVEAAAEPADLLALSGRLFGTLPWIALAAAATILMTLEWLTYHYRWTE